MKSRNITMRDVIIVSILLIGLFIYKRPHWNWGPKPQKQYGTPAYNITDKATAWQMTQKFVSKQLKSPSTAVYPKYYNMSDNIKDYRSTYTINSYVDSQNGYGAQIRSEFTAVVEDRGGGSWALTSLEFK